MPVEYRIKELIFADGKAVTLPNLTVLVGPNNCGKSRVLKDIVEVTCTRNPRPVVLRSVEQQYPRPLNELAELYDFSVVEDEYRRHIFHFLSPTLDKGAQEGFLDRKWPSGFGVGSPGQDRFFEFAPQLTAFLTTEARLTTVAEGDSSAESYKIKTLLQALYSAGRESELELRRVVTSAFPDLDIALDYSNPQRLQFRIGKDFRSLPADPREARPVLDKYGRLDDQGDGLRGYVGIATALTSLNRPVFLIDEPEAFLHPPQAFRVGQLIASRAAAGRQIIVATHSADVLRGIIFSNVEAQVIRIDRIADKNTVRVLDSGELRAVAHDPLLSAAGVLDGLFSSCVIVTEADADSRFYLAVSNKLEPGADIHFVNADNKQTVPRVLEIYRRLGVRCGGIVDIDVLNDREEFKKQIQAAGLNADECTCALKWQTEIAREVDAVAPAERLKQSEFQISEMSAMVAALLKQGVAEQTRGLGQLRANLERAKMNTQAWHRLKKEGVQGLAKSSGVFYQLAELCGKYGLFINPSGELEASLTEIGIPWESDKRSWIKKALQLLQNLVPDASKEPWKMMTMIHAHLRAARPKS